MKVITQGEVGVFWDDNKVYRGEVLDTGIYAMNGWKAYKILTDCGKLIQVPEFRILKKLNK